MTGWLIAIGLVAWVVRSVTRDQRIAEIAESLERIEQWLDRWEERERQRWAE